MKEPMPLAELVNAIGITIDNVYDDVQDGWSHPDSDEALLIEDAVL